MKISLVIPAYNEEAKIERDLEAACDYLAPKAGGAEILVVNDGSKDATQRVAEGFAWRNRTTVEIRVLSYGGNRGKGYAIRHGVEHARGERIAFADAGLCVPFRFLDLGLEQIDEGCDYAIASRRLPGTRIVTAQPLYRQLGSKGFWLVIQLMMGVKASDTQCGFKVYSNAAAKAIFPLVTTDGFMFDIEALMVAERLGLRRGEFPVEWANDSDTRYHPVWGTLRNFSELTRIRWRHA